MSTAVAVCQQSFKHPLAPVGLDSPAIGGACALRLPARTVSVTVDDSTWGLIPYEYQAVNITGERCGLYGVGASGAPVSFASNCTHVYVWPNFQATYGTIDVLAAS